MTFLCFGGNEATTLSATEKSSKNVRLKFWRFRFALVCHHFLNRIKKFLCDNRFMLSVIQFSVVLDNAVIDFILEHVLIIGDGKHFAFLANQAQGIDNLSDLSEGVFASRVHFKSPLDELRFFLDRKSVV